MESNTIKHADIKQKLHIAAFGSDLAMIGQVIRVIEQRRGLAKRIGYGVKDGEEHLYELFEYYNQMIKDLMGL